MCDVWDTFPPGLAWSDFLREKEFWVGLVLMFSGSSEGGFLIMQRVKGELVASGIYNKDPGAREPRLLTPQFRSHSCCVDLAAACSFALV